LWGAKLQKAVLTDANMQDASLQVTDLQGAWLTCVKLQGADFFHTLVDGKTIIVRCEIDKKTNFTGVGLDSARIDPGLKESLKYNIRRKHWIAWSKRGSWIKQILKRPVRFFWGMSDYGRSTIRIIITFLILWLGFAAIYWGWGMRCPPGVVENLFETTKVVGGNEVTESIGCGMAALRSVYFSIVTMTTLGFGDMHARATSVAGYILLMIQVIMGYVLLGALITRLGILFTSEGPPADFTPLEKPKKDKKKK